MTVAPSSRNNFAASSPMPEVPPVTRTILFDSFMIFSWSEGFEFVAGARDPLRQAATSGQRSTNCAVTLRVIASSESMHSDRPNWRLGDGQPVHVLLSG